MRDRTEQIRPPYRPAIGMIIALVITTVLYGQELEFKNEQLRENILQVADHFASVGEWQQAILNYYDFLYRFPDDSIEALINLKIATVYEKSGQFDLAEKHLRQTADKFHDTKYDQEIRLHMALLLYHQEHWEECIQYAYYQSELPFKIIVAYCLLNLNEIRIADSILAVIRDQFNYSVPIGDGLKQVLAQPVVLPWYQKWGAVAMSAVVPGAGRIYWGEIWDGVFNMAGFGGVLGATIYMARYQPQWFFLTSSAAIVFYGMNLYATYQSGERYFQARKRSQYVNILKEFPLSEQIHLGPLF